MNVALSHVLGATIQTALLNNPLVVIVGWGLSKTINLNFELFEIIIGSSACFRGTFFSSHYVTLSLTQ